MAHPVRTVYSDEVHTSPDPTIDDLHSTRTEHGHQSVWVLEDAEREAIAAGANIVLEVMASPHPAVSVAVGYVNELEDPVSEEALERAARAAGQRPCRCGHAQGEHYTYSLNGRDQDRCRSCDPLVHIDATLVSLTPEQAAQDRAADHSWAPLADA